MEIIINIKLSNDTEQSREDIYKQIKSQLFLLGTKSTGVDDISIICDSIKKTSNDQQTN